MKTINIFIASSFELTDWRNVIGDAIRQWSDEYEPKGFRIKMLCWEDYHPEYNGIRKQTEYNTDLVKNSHIFIGLFRNKCGKYTKEEIGVAGSEIELSKHTYLFCDSNGTPNIELKEFIAQNDGHIVYKEDIASVIASIRSILEDYISHLPQYLPQDIAQSKKVYATVGDDIFHEKFALGNAVRSLDYLAENELNMRCRLLRDDIALIDKSDYFIGIIKDNISNEKEMEICKAILQSGNSSNPQVSVLYFNHTDKALTNNANLQRIYSEREPFNEPFDGYHRIRFNLLVWLLSNRVLRIDENSGLQVSSSWVTYMGRKIIPISLLALDGKNDRELLKNLLQKIYNKLLFPHSLDAHRNDVPMDLEKVDKEISDLNFAEENGVYILSKTNQERLTLLKKIESRMSTIATGSTCVLELIKLNFRKEELQRQLLTYNLVSVEDLLRTFSDILRLFEEYPSLFDEDFNPDNYYYASYTIADEYKVIRPEIEMMRMNYANYLSRHNRNKEALSLYEQSLSRLVQLNDGTKLMTSYLISNYLNFIHSLLGLGLYEQGKRFIVEYQNMIDKYSRLHPEDKENESYKITVLTAWLVIWRYDDDAQNNLRSALEIWNGIKEKPLYVSDNLWDDVYCFFPTIIAANITDSSFLFEENRELISDAIQILDESIKIIQNTTRIDNQLKIQHLGQHYHNIANIISEHFNNQTKAREFALKSLEYRRKLYKMTHHKHALFEIANIQLMIGATYINGRIKHLTNSQSREALRYAEQSYRNFKSLNYEGFLGPETKEQEAKFLVGTILFFTHHRETEGWEIIKSCYSWHMKHPNNDYSETFEAEYKRFQKILSDRLSSKNINSTHTKKDKI